jgi:hypothetical protein
MEIRAQAERDSGDGLKLFGFIAESVFTFVPESCSGSSRNSVRNHPGIAFTFLRIPHLVCLAAHLKDAGVILRGKSLVGPSRCCRSTNNASTGPSKRPQSNSKPCRRPAENAGKPKKTPASASTTSTKCNLRYDPAEDGFVYSPAEVETEAHRRERRILAKIAEKVDFDYEEFRKRAA